MKNSCKTRFLPAITAIQNLIDSEKFPILVAIDGRCGCGKTTLGNYLAELFDCNLFHMDDFFLQPHQRTDERGKEIGGNVDYERFYEEVLCKIIGQQPLLYRPFSCRTMGLSEGVRMEPKRLNIIEGSYSLHPHFKDPYDLKIFMDIDPETQYQNILARNGAEKAEVFRQVWIPKEEAYFNMYHIESGCLKISWEDII